MKEDKLGDLSMELSVDVLNLCRRLKTQKKQSFQTKFAEALPVFAQILQKASMRTEELISLRNYKSL